MLKLEAGTELLVRHLAHLLTRNQFEDHFSLEDDVRPEALVEIHAFPGDRHRNLPGCWQALSLQLLRQNCFANRLKQSMMAGDQRASLAATDDGRVTDSAISAWEVALLAARARLRLLPPPEQRIPRWSCSRQLRRSRPAARLWKICTETLPIEFRVSVGSVDRVGTVGADSVRAPSRGRSDVNRFAEGSCGRFHQGFAQGRVSVDGVMNFLGGNLRLHAEDIFRKQLGSVVSNDVGAK